MTDNFKPPIKTRPTDDLLEIVGSPKKWNPDAVRLAKYELMDRNVPSIEIESAKQSAINKEIYEKQKIANESYSILDFILHPTGTFFELIFSWELKKDSYILKAKQQKALRILLLIVIIFVIIFNFFI